MSYHPLRKQPDSVVKLLISLSCLLLVWIMHSMVWKILFSK